MSFRRIDLTMKNKEIRIQPLMPMDLGLREIVKFVEKRLVHQDILYDNNVKQNL